MAASSESDTHASSTGHAFSEGDWLDVHFEAARPAYEAQVRAVGIQPGWRVLDLGSGSGAFLPWLADEVGPTGQIVALDLAPENIAIGEARLAGWHLATPVESRVGSMLAIPYPDARFDAVWCANVTQYLTDTELATALAEMRRVVRPGGLVAVKEFDTTLMRLLPAPIDIILHVDEEMARAGDVQALGCWRGYTLPAWLRRAGLVEVTRRTTLIEHAAPLPPMARTFCRDFVPYMVELSARYDLPDADRAFWATLRDPESIERLLDDPDFYLSEGNTLAVGRVPGV